MIIEDESTLGIKPFSIQFANDTAALLNALKIQKADVGVSMGSFIAQELALMSPNRVDSLILADSDFFSKMLNFYRTYASIVNGIKILNTNTDIYFGYFFITKLLNFLGLTQQRSNDSSPTQS